MPDLSPCPSLRELQRLFQGEATLQEAAKLKQHLARCPDCKEALKIFAIADSFLAPFQPPSPTAARPRSEPPPEQFSASNRAPAPTQAAATVPSLAPPAGAGPSLQWLFESGGGRDQRLPPSPMPEPEPPPLNRAPFPAATPPAARADTDLAGLLAPPQEPGELGRLGPYRVLRVIGTGGMGVVFQAEDLQLKRTVALKALKPVPETDATARQRFLREARAAAAIEQENVVSIYQVGEDRGVPYLAMQLLQGETLDARLKRENQLPILEVLRIGREIGEGLAAAHDRGLVHRDIKPANIWLEGERGRVKIVDFGIVRTSQEEQHLTKTGAVLGTPAYMSPEQARGQPVDPRSDLYSLGCVLYRMVTGRAPFQAEDMIGLMLALANEQPPPILSLNPVVPGSLVGLVNRLLAKVPEVRPPSAKAVIEVLQQIERRVLAMLPGGQRSTEGVNARPGPGFTLANPVVKVGLVVAVAVASFCGVVYGPTVVSYVKNEGQLLIYTDDPTTKIVLKQEGRTVVDASAERQIPLPAGYYDIELVDPKEGQSLSKTKFRLAPAERLTIRIIQAPPEAAKK